MRFISEEREVRELLSRGKEKEALERAEAAVDRLFAEAEEATGLWHVHQAYFAFAESFSGDLSAEFHHRAIRFGESMIRSWMESTVTRYSRWAEVALELQRPTDAGRAIERARSLAEFLGEPTSARERARRIDLDFLKDASAAWEAYPQRSTSGGDPGDEG